MLTAAATGFAIGLSLILTIGAQNAFVLRQGMIREHVGWVCLICAVSDAILIAVGVASIGTIDVAYPWATAALTWCGAGFLIIYGAISLRRALQPRALNVEGLKAAPFGAVLASCIALTWFNPHVYLETVGLIGAISTGFEGTHGKISYGVGAAMASFVFFFALGYGARLLAPVFSRPRAWAILDVSVALVMWTIASTLVIGGLSDSA